MNDGKGLKYIEGNLAHCPICGSKAHIEKTGEAEGMSNVVEFFMTYCDNRDCILGQHYCLSKEEAATKWNTRESLESGVVQDLYESLKDIVEWYKMLGHTGENSERLARAEQVLSRIGRKG